MPTVVYQGREISCEYYAKYGKVFLNSVVALEYGIESRTIRSHLNNNQDELLEGIHYIRDYVQTTGGKQKAIKWTVEGIHMLGFFIKSKQAKDFRKWTAKLLTEIKEERAKVIPMDKKTKHIILGYKSQLSQRNNKIAELEDKLKIKMSSQDEQLLIELHKENTKLKNMIELKEDPASLKAQIETLSAQLAISREKERRSSSKASLADDYIEKIESNLAKNIENMSYLLKHLTDLKDFGIEKTSYGSYRAADKKEEILLLS